MRAPTELLEKEQSSSHYGMRLLGGSLRTVAAMLALLCVCAATSNAATLVSCGPEGYSVGDLISRGFFIPEYPGSSLQSVALRFAGGTKGSGTITVTANAGAYNGPQIGSSTVNVSGPVSSATPITFTLRAKGVSRAVAFIITASGAVSASSIFYSVFGGFSGDPSFARSSRPRTSPRLDTIRRRGVESRSSSSRPSITGWRIRATSQSRRAAPALTRSPPPWPRAPPEHLLLGLGAAGRGRGGVQSGRVQSHVFEPADDQHHGRYAHGHVPDPTVTGGPLSKTDVQLGAEPTALPLQLPHAGEFGQHHGHRAPALTRSPPL